jgi:hypothetical protein
VGCWTASVSPIYLQSSFKKLDARIAKLASAKPYPEHFCLIHLLAPSSVSVRPDVAWYTKAFTFASDRGVRVSVDYVNTEDFK